MPPLGMADPGATLAPLTVRLRMPSLTEELVRYLRRMGFRATEIDYGVVEIERGTRSGEADVEACLAIWQRLHEPARFERELA